MVLKRLHPAFHILGSPFKDHTLILTDFSTGFHFPASPAALGLVTVLSGRLRCRCNDEVIELDPQSFLIVNRGSVVSFDYAGEPGQLMLLFFNPILADLLMQRVFEKNMKSTQSLSSIDPNDFSLVEHVHYSNTGLLENWKLLVRLADSCASFHALKADMLIRTVLNQIMDEHFAAIRSSASLDVVKRSTRVVLYKRLAMARNWIDHHYADADLETAAAVAMLNRFHFLRLFARAFGITPHRYLTRVRLEAARNLLNTSSVSVTEVCERVGFESPSTFRSLFKKHFGFSPVQKQKALANN